MRLLSEKLFIRLAYWYISLPLLIFFCGWLRWYYTLIFAGCLLISLFFCFKEYREFNQVHFSGNKRKVLVVIAVLLLWVFLSGIGRYSYQTGDHNWRNAVFSDLINHDWPVFYQVSGFDSHHPLEGKTCLLVYYIAFWLPAAVVGKLMGLQAANLFLFGWALLGLLLVFYFICRLFKSFSFQLLFLFIFWGSAYIVGSFIKYPLNTLISSEYVLWSGNMYYADNNTGLIYWVFNQSITPWLIILLLLNQVSGKNIFFLYSLCFFHGPFAFIGLFPFVIYIAARDSGLFKKKAARVFSALRPFISFQNTVGFFSVMIITYLYFSVNSTLPSFSFIARDPLTYLAFIILSFGIIALLLFKHFRQEPLFYIAVAVLLPLPFFKIEDGIDFCARVSIPAMFVLMLLVMKYLQEEKKIIKRLPVLLYLIVAAVLPGLQIARSFTLTVLQYSARLHTSLPPGRLAKKLAEANDHDILIKDEFKTLSSTKNTVIKNFMGDTSGRFFIREMARTRGL